MSEARIEIAYADHRDNRMIIVGAAAWETMAEQEARFAELPEVPESDFIADFYDEEGGITKDKSIAASTVATVLGKSIEAAIADGRRREDDLSAQVRSGSRGDSIPSNASACTPATGENPIPPAEAGE